MEVGNLRCFVLSITCDVQTAHAWTVLKYSGGFTSDNEFIGHLLTEEQRRQGSSASSAHGSQAQAQAQQEAGQSGAAIGNALEGGQGAGGLPPGAAVVDNRNGGGASPKKQSGPGRPPKEDKSYGHKAYKCDQCPKAFMYRSLLAVHYRKHSGEKPYQCRFCNRTFSQLGNCQKHEATCGHNETGAPPTQLHHPQSQQSAMALTTHDVKPAHAHSMAVQGVDYSQISHPQQRAMQQQQQQQQHAPMGHDLSAMNLQRNDRPSYRCEICSKVFFDPNVLENHRKRHSNRQQFQCKSCGKIFKHKGYCHVHQLKCMQQGQMGGAAGGGGGTSSDLSAAIAAAGIPGAGLPPN